MKDCAIDAKKLVCAICGKPASSADVRRNCRLGLGDYVHAGLAAVGITPQRVAAALGVDDCGCEGRRAWLNEAGHAIGIGTPPEDAKKQG
jgi:hypothetical protein